MSVHTVGNFSTDPNTKCESIEQSEIVLKTENEGGRISEAVKNYFEVLLGGEAVKWYNGEMEQGKG